MFSCKIILQATLKAPGHMKSPLDIIRHVTIQHVSCDRLFKNATFVLRKNSHLSYLRLA